MTKNPKNPKKPKNPNNKEEYIHIRIKEGEKKELLELAKAEGFERMTDFILWLYRQFKNKK